MSDRTDLVVILDRSGSMQDRRADHEGGLRAFVRDAIKLAGDVRLTFVRFDEHDPCEVVFSGRPVAEVREEDLTVTPRGGTPLLDAVGQALTLLAAQLGERTVVMIITDGAENMSRTWTKAGVQALITAREAAGWRVLYLGANVDAFAEAGALGVHAHLASTYADTPRGVTTMYQTLASNVAAVHAAATGGVVWASAASNLTLTPAQRAAMNPTPNTAGAADAGDLTKEAP